jgi:hypothetical protein
MNSYQRDTEPFLILRDEEVSILRAGPVITTLRLTNWSADRSLLNKLLELYHPSLRTLSLHGAPSSFPLLTTLVPTTPLQPLHLALEPPLAPALLDWLINPTNRPHVRAFEFTRRPEHAVLAALLTAHGNTLTALALPTLTAADAALVASLQRTPAPASSCSARNTRTLRSRWDARIYVMWRSLRAQRWPLSAGRCARPRALRTTLIGGTRAGAETGAAGGRLERLTVMLWHGHEEELEICIEFERDVKAFRAFWVGVVQKRT